MRKGKLTVLFNSMPVEVREDSVVIDVNGTTQEVPNDYVWIFAGGEPPTVFLRKIGIELGMHDMTEEGSREAREAEQSKKSLTPAGLGAAG